MEVREVREILGERGQKEHNGSEKKKRKEKDGEKQGEEKDEGGR